jgi:hypothetical protein
VIFRIWMDHNSHFRNHFLKFSLPHFVKSLLLVNKQATHATNTTRDTSLDWQKSNAQPQKGEIKCENFRKYLLLVCLNLFSSSHLLLSRKSHEWTGPVWCVLRRKDGLRKTYERINEPLENSHDQFVCFLEHKFVGNCV